MSENDALSRILVCKNTQKAKEFLEERYSGARHVWYEKEDFLLDDAKELIKEAYIAEVSNKYLIVLSRNYRIEAQNALLKILEEPPSHIVFILVASSKSAFLPTIRSRLPLEELRSDAECIRSGLNLKKLDIEAIYSFVQAHQNVDKNMLKELVQAIVYEAIHERGLRFSEREMDYFQKLVHLCELNTRPQTVFISLLLTILHRRQP